MNSTSALPTKNPSADVAVPPARILIVDDESQNRQLLELMLGPEGFDIQNAAGGEEALALVAAYPPDLILLDVMMPDMDGYQVTARIKGNTATKNIPIIMVTAMDDRPSRMHGLSAGAEDFLTKPVDRGELSMRVRNLLRLKAYSDRQDKYSNMLEKEVGLRTADVIASERLYRSTFDAAPVGVIHLGLTGEWLRVNQRLCDLLGYSREELQQAGGSGLAQSEEVAGEAEAFRQMLAGTIDRHVLDEKRYRKCDGTFVWARVNIAIHRESEGQAQRFILVIEDITERRALEAQVRQTSKMDAIGRLASGVAHDFNNLLTVILGCAELMVEGDVSEDHADDLQEIIKAGRRAAGLTRQLLAFGRQQVLTPAPLDTNALITDLSGMLTRLIGEDIAIALSLDPRLSKVLADRGQLEQVVMNLVVNARDAMPRGGSITIQTADVELESSSDQEELVTGGAYVMIAITDTGTGMSKETQRRLFEPFYTTKEPGKGTGLGLSTTYGIIKQSKGYIWVHSEIGQGTTFRVYLPSAKSGAKAKRVSASVAAPVKRPTETVLLVEDDPAVRRLSTRILDHAGYRVLEAGNGNDAETLVARHAGALDLVVTDMIMPGCGGPELLQRLRVTLPTLKVLYMSGYTEDSAAQRTSTDRGVSFVQKPFTATEFAKQVRKALDQR